MGEKGRERTAVTLERVRHDAVLIIIRLGLGHYELTGPRDNILEPESYVVWATVANELAGEGYVMVSPAEYAEACGTTVDEVLAEIRGEGGLFALAYRAEGASGMVVPLPEKEELLPEIQG
ncbi:MAG TPA: hypothetical protein VL949_11035 [Geobacteraceae bacterium]|jgi:hypothetical protein|nr:hypothetical protein [Geobacteraceae bacterium]